MYPAVKALLDSLEQPRELEPSAGQPDEVGLERLSRFPFLP